MLAERKRIRISTEQATLTWSSLYSATVSTNQSVLNSMCQISYMEVHVVRVFIRLTFTFSLVRSNYVFLLIEKNDTIFELLKR